SVPAREFFHSRTKTKKFSDRVFRRDKPRFFSMCKERQ
ncbi:DUF1661 domain-containing protein, partial [Porphyromonas gulae]